MRQIVDSESQINVKKWRSLALGVGSPARGWAAAAWALGGRLTAGVGGGTDGAGADPSGHTQPSSPPLLRADLLEVRGDLLATHVALEALGVDLPRRLARRDHAAVQRLRTDGALWKAPQNFIRILC